MTERPDFVREGLLIGRAEDRFPGKIEWAGSWYEDRKAGAGADVSIRETDRLSVEIIDDPFDYDTGGEIN